MIFSGTVENNNNKISQDTIQWLTCVVQYLNMKMKVKLVEIIDLKRFSSLKWDGVWKKGTSWDGPRLELSMLLPLTNLKDKMVNFLK